ncbi:MAG: MerC domain-containing protein [Capsulimonadales bacterium]|nr:MerC domain-containing protein [Capsulimonadales bacterium]
MEGRANPEKPAADRPTATVDVLDRVGATASIACAVHCALMPLVVTLLPLIGLSFLADERVEWGLLALSATVGIVSLCLGFRTHRSRRALTLLSVGIGLASVGRILESRHIGPWGVPAVVVGGLIVAGAHLFNQYLCLTCRSCQTH